jgi:hypothetical protein
MPSPTRGPERTDPDRSGVDVLSGRLDDTDVAVVAAAISECLPPHVREGLARRRLVLTGSRCPCGATAQLPNRADRRAAQRAGRIVHATVAHALDCPAIHPDTVAAARAAFRGAQP